MLPALDAVIEQRIRDAAARGEFDGLPGQGQPLDLDDDRMIPEDLRVAYRILKNSGYVPPEMQTFKEIAELERLVQTLSSGEERTAALKKLRLLTMQVNTNRGGNLQLEADHSDLFVASLNQ
jgi:hypothetical protein